MRYKLQLAVTDTGKAYLYNDSNMPIIKQSNRRVIQLFPIPSKVAVKRLLADYKGAHRLEVSRVLNDALKLF